MARPMQQPGGKGDQDTVTTLFIQEIEHAMGLGPAKQCPLREFLTVYIKNIFLNQVLAEINKEIEGVTKTADPLKILANADTMKVLGVQRPLLQGEEGQLSKYCFHSFDDGQMKYMMAYEENLTSVVAPPNMASKQPRRLVMRSANMHLQ
ncbi:hypothetical protein ACRRTK_015818 [Alexandromys fortis]